MYLQNMTVHPTDYTFATSSGTPLSYGEARACTSKEMLFKIDLRGTGFAVNKDVSNCSIHDWCNKGRGMCYSVCGMVHIKEPLLLIGKSSPCGGSGFPLSLSEWSFTIYPT